MKKNTQITLWGLIKSPEFRLPGVILSSIILGFCLREDLFYVLAIFLGLLRLLWESAFRIRDKKWNLDYLAFLALSTSFLLSEWVTGAIIAFMVAVSAALEMYGTNRAEKTLHSLFEKIPKTILLKDGEKEHEVALQVIQSGDVVLIRSNEMLPLDGELVSERALFNEANLTGEMEAVAYSRGAFVYGGVVNLGEAILVRVQGDFEQSSYRKILSLVSEGKKHPAMLTRLSERANIYFTLFALVLAFGAYFFSGDWERFLAVVVIATPCPLLIAAPISFIGGLNKAARKNIIIKGPFVLELLAKTKVLFFDKTGTLTLGEPKLKKIVLLDPHLDQEEALNLAASLERHSLHPLAKSLLRAHKEEGGEIYDIQDVEEKIGEGMFGTFHGSKISLVKSPLPSSQGIIVELCHDNTPVARFFFDDVLKEKVGTVFTYLRERGYRLGILTGDKKANADRILGAFQIPLYAECTPVRKADLVTHYQKSGCLVGMVGDGMNDAPALALADLGIVFSGTDNSASLEAADVAILGNDVERIKDAIHIGRRSYAVALQSILLGIGLSSCGMLLASFGFIPPFYGALLQEAIDVVVIVNALRSTY
ncbi:MAG: heavy metal translocating P-type ATPase [Patescibacteria group bacterium]